MTYSAVGEGKVLPNRNVRLGMFELGMELKEIHLGYSTRFLFREKDLRRTYILFTEHPRMTAPVDSSVSIKVLSIGYTLLVFPSFFFSIDNCNQGSLLRKYLKMKVFLLFTRF